MVRDAPTVETEIVENCKELLISLEGGKPYKLDSRQESASILIPMIWP